VLVAAPQQVAHWCGRHQQDELRLLVILLDGAQLVEQLGVGDRLMRHHQIPGHDNLP
jgi:hypothetical protein